MPDALDLVVGTDRLPRATQVAGEGAVQHLVDQGALAGAGDAGHRDERPERELHVDVLEVVLARSADVQALPVPAPPRAGHRDLAVPPEERAGDRAGLREHGLEGAVGDDLAAVLPRPGADVDHPVGRPDRLLVVLHDEDGVAEVAEAGQGRDQLRVVALVEPDRRLVEDVQDAHQRRADLGREPDPLRLAAGERDARAVEGQVVQAHVDEEAEPGDDLLEHLAADGALALRHLVREARTPVERVGDAEARDLADAAAVDAHREHLGAQPAALAGRAGLGDHELLELGPDVLRVRLAVAPLEVGHHPLERGDVAVLAALVAVAHDDLLVLGGVEQVVHRLLRQVLHRGVDAPAMRGEDRVRDLHPPRDLGRHLVPRGQGAVAHGPGAVRDHEVRVHDQLRPEARAGRAGAVRAS